MCSPTSSPTGAGGSTTRGSSSAAMLSSPSTPAPPSGGPAGSSTPSRASRPRPVRTLVNTHHHGDHTNGNCLFGGATIVAHRNCREAVKAQRIGGLDAGRSVTSSGVSSRWSPPFRDLRRPRPTLHVDDLRVDVDYIGMPAHTTGDAVLWLAEPPSCSPATSCSTAARRSCSWARCRARSTAVERLRQFGARTIVPGHGAVCGPERLDAIEGYLTFVQRRRRRGQGRRRSATRRGPRSRPRASTASWLDVERIVGNLHRAYCELDGQPLGAPIDIVAAFLDMIAFNGDRPLRCLA